MEFNQSNPTTLQLVESEDSPLWIFGDNYWYRTSSTNTDNNDVIWNIHNQSSVYLRHVNDYNYVVRPVITLSKIALGNEVESIVDINSNHKSEINKNDNEISQIKSTVKVDNTYMRNSIITIIIGFIIASASIFILYKLRNKAK